MWPQFEQLKREVLQLNVANAASAGKPPFPLWDFSGYNSINTEPVPAIDDNRSRMKYFFDGTHSTPLLGKLVQDVIFSVSSAGAQAPEDFGVRLLTGNIESLLAADRVARDDWVSSHSQDVAEIVALQ